MNVSAWLIHLHIYIWMNGHIHYIFRRFIFHFLPLYATYKIYREKHIDTEVSWKSFGVKKHNNNISGLNDHRIVAFNFSFSQFNV